MMPGSKCQIVVLAGKTGHFTDIIKNKKRGGKTNEQDNEDKQAVSGDRYLDTAFRDFSGIYPVCSFDGCDAADAFEPASVFDAGYWIYDHKQGRPEKVDAI